MVRRTSQRRSKISISAQARRRRPRRNRRKAGRNTGRVGTMLIKGTRTVLSALPSKALKFSVSDYTFRSFGWAKTKIGKVNADVVVTGLYGAFSVSTSMLMGSSPDVGLILSAHVVDPNLPPNPATVKYGTQWRSSRLVSLTIRAKPSGPMGTSSGSWAIAFVPFASASAHDSLVGEVKKGFSLADLTGRKHATGSVRQSLTLRHYFTPSDGYAFSPGVHDVQRGMIQVAYEDTNRLSYADFDPTDFQCNIFITGKVILFDKQYQTYTEHVNSVTDLVPANQLMSVATPDGLVQITSDAHVIEQRDSCFSVRLRDILPQSLEEMAIS